MNEEEIYCWYKEAVEAAFKEGWYARHDWPADADMSPGIDTHEDWKASKARAELISKE